jgi:hypothetical protein
MAVHMGKKKMVHGGKVKKMAHGGMMKEEKNDEARRSWYG